MSADYENKLKRFAFVVIIWIIGFLTVSAFTPENTKLTLHFVNAPLIEVIREIENQSEYTFVFNTTQINMQQQVSVDVKDVEVNDVLRQVFEACNIRYQFMNNHIVLTLPDESSSTIQEVVTISGTVTDQENEPLPGVNVYVKNTTEGTITDLDGNYSLDVEIGDALVFSYVGYVTREFTVTREEVINVQLEEETTALEEVVVIGYGTESRALISSSVGTVSANDLVEAPAADLSGALQGRAAGIRVIQNSGAPGKGITVRIRGVSSILAGSEPLYVVDGVPVITTNLGQIGFSGQGINTISDLNPSEIESISILKDASATAVYGARASNGVVLITTKRGSANRSRINFNASYGWQKVAKTLDLLNAREFMEYRNDASINDGGVAIYSEDDINNNTIDTDWQSEIFRTAPIENYDLSFSGGGDKTQYFMSAGYFNQDGILLGTDYAKISSRLNLDHKVNERLKVGSSIGISRSENNRKEGDQSLNGPVPNAISQPPIFPVYNDDGTYNDDGPFANPLSIASYHKNLGISFRTMGNIFAELEIIEGLVFSTKVGLDYVNYKEHTYDPSITRQGGKYKGLGLASQSDVTNAMITNTLSYRFNLNDNHKFNLLVANSYESYTKRSMYIRGQDFPSPELEYIVSAANIVGADTRGLDRRLNSYVGRLKYNFSNKYLFTFAARYDGSSRFGANSRYGFFPSGDVAWRIAEEDFFPDMFINDLKVRFSIGQTGNDQIPDFSSLALYSSGRNYYGLPGIAASQLPNPDLKWETTTQTNLGFDIQMFRGRIGLQADLYKKVTTDLLLDRPIPLSSGFGSITSNIGSMENKGLELNLYSSILESPVLWEINLNASFNRNRVTELYNDQPIEDVGRGYNRVMVNEPISIFWGWVNEGVDPTTGDLVFDDLDGNGIIDANDREKIGNPHPVVVGGVGNKLSYKGFELSMFMQYSYGNDLFNGARRYIEVMKGIDNQTRVILDRWRQVGDITDVPRATNSDPNGNDRQSSRFIEDGSYLKIKNLKLSYRFSNQLINRLTLSSLSVYILAENIYTFTNYSGLDPEVNYAGQDNLRMGTDFFTYPQAKSLSLGISVGL